MASTLTAEQLVAIYDHPNTVTPEQAKGYLPYLVAACKEFGITTKLRVAGFLSQLGAESGELIYWEELADGWAYEWREDLGNINEGDGPWFKGHGPIQITGRGNHTACGEALGLDLLNQPTLIGGPHPLSTAQIINGFRSAGWYWTKRGNDYRELYGWPVDLNLYADAGDIDAMCVGVNGGWNGYDERIRYYNKAMEVLPDDLDLSAQEGTAEPAIERSETVAEVTWSWYDQPWADVWAEPDTQSPVYQFRCPTRYEWRPDIEAWPQWLVNNFNVSCNTYYNHPEQDGLGLQVASTADDGTIWYVMNTSFDVWGPGGRNDPLGSTVGWQIFGLLMNDPNPPNIRWIIYFGQMYGAWNNWEGEFFAPYGDFMYHGDHIHVTYW